MFPISLAPNRPGQLADAVGDDLSKCTATSSWVGKDANVPSGFSCYVARAVLDQLAGNEIEDSTGDKRGDLGDKVPTDVEIAQHSGAMVASQCCEGQHTEGKHPVTIWGWCYIRGYTCHWAICRAVGRARLHAERAASRRWLRGAMGNVSSVAWIYVVTLSKLRHTHSF